MASRIGICGDPGLVSGLIDRWQGRRGIGDHVHVSERITLMRDWTSCQIQFWGNAESGFGHAELEMTVGHLSRKVWLAVR